MGYGKTRRDVMNVAQSVAEVLKVHNNIMRNRSLCGYGYKHLGTHLSGRGSILTTLDQLLASNLLIQLANLFRDYCGS